MQIHELKRRTSLKKSTKVGRGGTRGKTSGKGHKGQKARAGRKIRPNLRDIIKKIPKKRGYRFNSIKNKPEVVNLGNIEENFKKDEMVSPKTLLKKGLVRTQKGRVPAVKILANGEISKKLSFENVLVSEKAIEKIKKSGSSIKTK